MAQARQNNPLDGDEAVRRTASKWFIERDHGLTSDRSCELERWLDADPRHAEAFGEFEETWNLLGRLAMPQKEGLQMESAAQRAAPRRAKVPWLAVAAGLALALSAGVFWRSQRVGTAPLTFRESARTALGEHRRLTLPDGSVLQLNTESAVSVSLTANGREIQLTQGEVQFQVAKSPGRPFVVKVGPTAIHDIGTVFDIRLKPDSMEVLVTEGSVNVVDPSGSRMLSAGERGVIPRGGSSVASENVVRIDSAAMDRALAWRDGYIEYKGQTLADITAEFNRYNEHKLRVDDSELAGRRFSGKFPINDYSSFVRVMENNFGVTAEELSDATVLRLAR